MSIEPTRLADGSVPFTIQPTPTVGGTYEVTNCSHLAVQLLFTDATQTVDGTVEVSMDGSHFYPSEYTGLLGIGPGTDSTRAVVVPVLGFRWLRLKFTASGAGISGAKLFVDKVV